MLLLYHRETKKEQSEGIQGNGENKGSFKGQEEIDGMVSCLFGWLFYWMELGMSRVCKLVSVLSIGTFSLALPEKKSETLIPQYDESIEFWSSQIVQQSNL